MRVTTIQDLGEDKVRAAFMASADRHFGRKMPRPLRKFLRKVPIDELASLMFDLTGAIYFNLEVGDEVVVFHDVRKPVAGSC